MDSLGVSSDTNFAATFREHLRRVIEDETGLPPCSEVDFNVLRDPMKREHILLLKFPGPMEAIWRFSDHALALTNISGQMDMVDRAIRQMARDWKTKI